MIKIGYVHGVMKYQMIQIHHQQNMIQHGRKRDDMRRDGDEKGMQGEGTCRPNAHQNSQTDRTYQHHHRAYIA